MTAVVRWNEPSEMHNDCVVYYTDGENGVVDKWVEVGIDEWDDLPPEIRSMHRFRGDDGVELMFYVRYIGEEFNDA